MDRFKTTDKKNRILMNIYGSSLGISLTALTIVGVLEICMLIYSLIDPGLFGDLIWRYRTFYIILLTLAVIYIILNLCVKKDIENRFVWLNIANPVCAILFFAWALAVTYTDATKYGVVDATVFMTFSLTVPLSFYLFPVVYGIIVIVADILMLYMTVAISGSAGPLINTSIFFIFQIVLGISFLKIKVKLAERIVKEQENAVIDVMTGLPNRRAYEEEIEQLSKQPMVDNLIYVAIDVNGLKGVNDNQGHDAGDQLLIGAAQCMVECFGGKGELFRTGGDEFAALLYTEKEVLERLLIAFDKSMQAWSEGGSIVLTASYGYVSREEFPDLSITELVKLADKKMYEAKAAYYQMKGHDRRS